MYMAFEYNVRRSILLTDRLGERSDTYECHRELLERDVRSVLAQSLSISRLDLGFFIPLSIGRKPPTGIYSKRCRKVH